LTDVHDHRTVLEHWDLSMSTARYNFQVGLMAILSRGHPTSSSDVSCYLLAGAGAGEDLQVSR